MKILVVDDDTALTKLISNKLKQNNYVVEVAQDGEYAMDLLEVSPYSLVILDIVLPRASGLEVCQNLRNQGNHTPILMLTGKDHIQDKVTGLDAGADDYLVKPFELNELAARVRALIRRNAEDGSTVLSYGDLAFDTSTQIMSYRGQSLGLRPKELAILELMLRYPSHILSPAALLDQLWNLADCPSRDTIKTHIRSLRKQLKKAGAHDVIETLYGRGYRLNPNFLQKAPTPPLSEETQSSGQVASPEAPKPLTQTTAEAKKNSAPPPSDYAIVSQTWQQVQAITWQHFTQLQAQVQTLGETLQQWRTRTPGTVSKPLTGTTVTEVDADASQQRESLSEASNQSPDTLQKSWQKTCQSALAIAHQLKGTLGSFGFQSASTQAQKVEQQLKAVSNDSSQPLAKVSLMGTDTNNDISTINNRKVERLLHEVDQLQQLLQPHITDPQLLAEHPLEQSFSATSTTSLLIVSEDKDWGMQLQAAGKERIFNVNVCSPNHITDYLLERTPSAIFLELSSLTDHEQKTLKESLEENLLDILVGNYGTRVPVLAVVSAENRHQQQRAIQKGAQAIALKQWSCNTLLAIASEYMSPQPSPIKANHKESQP
ncbi:MAG: response regulator [Cyanobacteria bacterium P01_F01_bin.53]